MFRTSENREAYLLIGPRRYPWEKGQPLRSPGRRQGLDNPLGQASRWQSGAWRRDQKMGLRRTLPSSPSNTDPAFSHRDQDPIYILNWKYWSSD